MEGGRPMSDNSVFHVTPELAESAWCDEAAYFKLYEQSIADPEGFCGEHGKSPHWFKPYTPVKDTSFGADAVHIRWFADGTIQSERTRVVSGKSVSTRATHGG